MSAIVEVAATPMPGDSWEGEVIMRRTESGVTFNLSRKQVYTALGLIGTALLSLGAFAYKSQEAFYASHLEDVKSFNRTVETFKATTDAMSGASRTLHDALAKQHREDMADLTKAFRREFDESNKTAKQMMRDTNAAARADTKELVVELKALRKDLVDAMASVNRLLSAKDMGNLE